MGPGPFLILFPPSLGSLEQEAGGTQEIGEAAQPTSCPSTADLGSGHYREGPKQQQP